MPTRVEIPGVGIVEFPDSMTPEQIRVKAGELSSRGSGAAVATPPAGTPPTDVRGFFGGVKQAVKQGALPVIGSVAGGIAGGMIASPTVAGVPAGVLAGEAVGGALGEGANQLLGITEPSAGQVAVSAMAPGAGRAVAAGAREAFRYGGRYLPGASVAAQEEGGAMIRALPQAIRPSAKASDLYAIVEQFDPKIQTINLQQALGKVLSHEYKVADKLRSDPIVSGVQSLHDLIAQTPGGELSFQVLRANLQRLGALSGKTARSGDVEHGAYKALVRAAHEDLEAAAAGGMAALPATQALREANRAAAKEFAQEELADIVTKVGFGKRANMLDLTGQQELREIRPGKILDAIRATTPEAKQFRKSLDPAEYREIEATLKELVGIRPLPPVQGAQFGSGRTLGRATFGSAAGLLLGGSPEATAVGGAVAAYGPQVIANALMTSWGRRTLIGLTKSGRMSLDHRTLSLLAAGLAAQAGVEAR